jgi:hypothetical protein
VATLKDGALLYGAIPDERGELQQFSQKGGEGMSMHKINHKLSVQKAVMDLPLFPSQKPDPWDH